MTNDSVHPRTIAAHSLSPEGVRLLTEVSTVAVTFLDRNSAFFVLNFNLRCLSCKPFGYFSNYCCGRITHDTTTASRIGCIVLFLKSVYRYYVRLRARLPLEWKIFQQNRRGSASPTTREGEEFSRSQRHLVEGEETRGMFFPFCVVPPLPLLTLVTDRSVNPPIVTTCKSVLNDP